MNYDGLEISLKNKKNIDFGIGLLKMNDILCQQLGKRVLDKTISELVNSLDEDNSIENYRETILPTNYANMRLNKINLNRACEKLNYKEIDD